MENLINGLKTNRSFAVSSLLVLALLALAAAAPVLSPYDPVEATMQNAYLEPSAEHIFGTDKLGRDVFSRILYGARYSLSGVLLLVAVIFLVGTSLGIISGYYGGKVDTVIMRISDMMISFPGMILAIAIAGILGGSLVNAVIALTIVSWTKYARLARSQALAQQSATYMQAAKMAGNSTFQMIYKHVIPNISGPILVTAMLDIGTMMMELAGLSFLGLCAKPPIPEWGSMMSDTRNLLATHPWVTLSPGVAIFVSVMVFNLLGDTGRDWLDPKNRR